MHVLISFTSLKDPLGSFYMTANMLVQLSSFFPCLQVHVNPNLQYLITLHTLVSVSFYLLLPLSSVLATSKPVFL